MKYVRRGEDYTIFHSLAIDALELAPIMRKSDQMEIMASNNLLPLTALYRCINVSNPCLTLRFKGEIAAMFGISTLYKTIWLLGSDLIKKHSETFIKLTHEMIAIFLEDEPYLFNFVDTRNKTSIRWLKKSGAIFDDVPVPVGVDNMPFLRFEFRRKE